jgi:hypothetical protein
MSFSEIFEGWKNHLAPSEYLKATIVSVSGERYAICKGCPLASMNNANANPLRFDEHCTACGCPLATKTKCLSCHCPKHYWEAVITEEEDVTINNPEDEKAK